MSGHVFVALSDITRLRCDAWLLPSDVSFHFTKSWLKSEPRTVSDSLSSLALRERWESRVSRRTLAIEPWYPALGLAPAPVPIVTDVGAFSEQSIGWYLDGLSAFVEAAIELANRDHLWRTKRLFAVPLIGTGAGGKSAEKGEMQRAILDRLEFEASRFDVDLALVLAGSAAFTAAQAVRRTSVQWPFNERENQRLDELASHAVHGSARALRRRGA